MTNSLSPLERLSIEVTPDNYEAVVAALLHERARLRTTLTVIATRTGEVLAPELRLLARNALDTRALAEQWLEHPTAGAKGSNHA